MQVINKTFEPFYEGPLPEGLAPSLIDRFNCKDGYKIYPDIIAYIQRLSKSPHRKRGSTNRIVVGVITNSDDRVPDVLSSLGLRVNHLRHGMTPASASEFAGESHDIDFAIMSYDVGFEKPDRRIFDAATDVLKSILTAEGHADNSLADWSLLYIGDEMVKDGHGATQAGWNAAVVDRSNVDANGDLPGVSYKTLVDGKELDVLSDFSALKNLKKQFPLLID